MLYLIDVRNGKKTVLVTVRDLLIGLVFVFSSYRDGPDSCADLNVGTELIRLSFYYHFKSGPSHEIVFYYLSQGLFKKNGFDCIEDFRTTQKNPNLNQKKEDQLEIK